MSKPRFIQLQFREFSRSDMLRRSWEFAEELHLRRTVREFSDRPVPKEIIENCIRAAGSSPSGANLQPWQFVAVSDPDEEWGPPNAQLATRASPGRQRRKGGRSQSRWSVGKSGRQGMAR